MKILDRYIATQMIFVIFLVMFALLGVDVFFYFVNELRYVGKGDYSLLQALLFIALTIPRKIYIIFPWSALLGTLLALGNLSKYSELVAMRVASVSIARIAWSAIKTGIILTTIMFVSGEIISPMTEAFAQRKKTLALSSGQAIHTMFGTWIRHNDQFINIGMVQPGDRLSNITQYNFDEQLQLKEVTSIAIAEKQADKWALSNINSTKFAVNMITVDKKDNYNVTELLDTEILQASAVKHLERLSLLNLWRVMKSRVAQDLNSTEYELAFWLKVIQPFAVLVMVLLAVPFAFGPLRSASLGLKILVGVLVGFGFHILNSVFGPLTAVTGLAPFLAATLPTMIFFVFAFVMVRRLG